MRCRQTNLQTKYLQQSVCVIIQGSSPTRFLSYNAKKKQKKLPKGLITIESSAAYTTVWRFEGGHFEHIIKNVKNGKYTQ